MVKHWATLNIRPLIYINPYFSNISSEVANSTDANQFEEAYEKGYFIMD